MMRVMQVHVVSPGWVETYSDVVHVRIEATDGARGFQAGHERALACLQPGPIELTSGDGARSFVATEGGVVSVDDDGLRVITPWATAAADLATLADAVRARRELRRTAEAEARALALRHEKAAQRALVSLRQGAES